MTETIVEARNMVKKYGDSTAVKDVNFTIQEGEIFGLLGPNGAGKSTAISMLTCLFPPTSGTARIYEHDVVADADQVKQLIGVVPQDLALYPTLSGRDNLRFFGEMSGLAGTELRRRVGSALESVAMTERAGDPVKTYSGGMKRCINLAVGLIHRPRILFLDEPTAGVDPQSRSHILESVERLNREEDTSILYATDYMKEAEQLCNRVAIIHRGEIIAMDTPKRLIELLGAGIIHLGLPRQDEAWRQAVGELSQVKAATFLPAADGTDGSGKAVLKVETRNANEALIQMIGLFNELDIAILSIKTLEFNLENVFLHLTGQYLRQ